MLKVTLQFPNVYVLWTFAQKLPKSEIEINTRTNTLSCYCSEELIEEAMRNHNARRVEENPLQHPRISTI